MAIFPTLPGPQPPLYAVKSKAESIQISGFPELAPGAREGLEQPYCRQLRRAPPRRSWSGKIEPAMNCSRLQRSPAEPRSISELGHQLSVLYSRGRGVSSSRRKAAVRGQVGLLLEMHRIVTQCPPGDASSCETETLTSLARLLLLKGDVSPM